MDSLNERFETEQLEGDGAAKAKAEIRLAITRRRAEEVAEEVGTSGYVARNWLCEKTFLLGMGRAARDIGPFSVEQINKIEKGEATLPTAAEPLSKLAEQSISDEVMKRVTEAEPEWLLVAAKVLEPIAQATAKAPGENQWTKKRAAKVRAQARAQNEGVMLRALAEDDGQKLSVEATLQAIRHRFHQELEKFLPSDTERELLEFLCGCSTKSTATQS